MRGIIDLPCLDKNPATPFPPSSQALISPNGLLAWGGDLHPQRLLAAYRAGIFPWYSDNQPILWWSPTPRCILFPSEVHVSKRTRRRYNSGRFTLTADTAFRQVIQACAQARGDAEGTWITQEMATAYEELHRMGHAHSVEAWLDGQLAGGIYGLAIGQVFFGESMFTGQTDAGKICLIALCRQLQRWNFEMLDSQVSNPHMLSMGAREISRQEFEKRLAEGIACTRPAESWTDLFKPEATL